MTMKTLFLVILTLAFTLTSFAKSEVKAKSEKTNHLHDSHQKKGHDHKGHKHEKDHKMKADLKKTTPTSALIKVQGMVCAFCAQGIEKNFNKMKEVKKTDVDLDKMEVLITYKKGQSLTKKQIEETVTGAGFAFKGLKNAQ